VAAPTLVLHGTRERIATAAGAEALRAIPKVEFVSVEGASHLPYVARPDLCVPALESFLGTVDTAEGAAT
jgi:pimeloyl-ACP methyl ester carboxylesterase